VEFVGPQVGQELTHDGLMALGMVVLGIMIYLAFRFEWKFAVAAIIANLHDIVIILGFFAFFQWEFSLTVLAAVLAVLGYSVNESVVVFDRVRETFRDRRYGKLATADVMNHAITSTISRTIITHGSTEAMVLSMLLFGGPTNSTRRSSTLGSCAFRPPSTFSLTWVEFRPFWVGRRISTSCAVPKLCTWLSVKPIPSTALRIDSMLAVFG
jgi:preprotein translocase SecF subunit